MVVSYVRKEQNYRSPNHDRSDYDKLQAKANQMNEVI